VKRATDQSLEALKTLVVMFGPREAARQSNLNENTVVGLAWRRHWKKATNIDDVRCKMDDVKIQHHTSNILHSSQTPSVPNASQAPTLSTLQKKEVPKSNHNQSPSKAVSNALSTLRGRSLIGLATYSAKAAEAAAVHKRPLDISRKAKDISDVHKAIYPPETNQSNILQIGILIQPDTD
jgi:hypothetical protein